MSCLVTTTECYSAEMFFHLQTKSRICFTLVFYSLHCTHIQGFPVYHLIPVYTKKKMYIIILQLSEAPRPKSSVWKVLLDWEKHHRWLIFTIDLRFKKSYLFCLQHKQGIFSMSKCNWLCRDEAPICLAKFWH